MVVDSPLRPIEKMPIFERATMNSSVPAILSHLSSSSLASLNKEIDMKIHPQSMFWYPVNFSIFLYSLWAIALCLHDYVLPSRFLLGNRWKGCGSNRRTMIVYLLSILLTSISLTLQIASSSVMRLDIEVKDIDMIRTAGTLITVLYLFEMIYRERMRFAMLCHHSLTIFAIGFVIVLMDKTQDPSFVITGTLWLFQATTEQLTFVALYGYRLEWSPRVLRPMLQVAAVQSLLVKMASIVACIYVWFKFQKSSEILPSYNRAWDAVIWVAAIGLMATQFWGSWVVWKMGASLEARYESKRIQRNAQHDPPATNSLEMLDVRTSVPIIRFQPALSNCSGSSLHHYSRSDKVDDKLERLRTDSESSYRKAS